MKTILVIEDEKPILSSVIELLEYEGFSGLSTTKGEEGYEIAQTQKPDLILCDIWLPDISGYEILKRLRANVETAEIPFVFMTAKASNTEEIAEANVPYLIKPFEVDELLDLVQSML